MLVLIKQVKSRLLTEKVLTLQEKNYHQQQTQSVAWL